MARIRLGDACASLPARRDHASRRICESCEWKNGSSSASRARTTDSAESFSQPIDQEDRYSETNPAGIWQTHHRKNQPWRTGEALDLPRLRTTHRGICTKTKTTTAFTVVTAPLRSLKTSVILIDRPGPSMSDMGIYRQLFEKHSEHKERETQSASDQENSTTDCCRAFESSGSIVLSQGAFSAKAVEDASESGRNRKDREQFHGPSPTDFVSDECSLQLPLTKTGKTWIRFKNEGWVCPQLTENECRRIIGRHRRFSNFSACSSML